MPRWCQDSWFFHKRKQIEEEEKSGLQEKWESVQKEVCKMYLIDCELEIQDEDYLAKMGIDKNDCINELGDLNTFGVVNWKYNVFNMKELSWNGN